MGTFYFCGLISIVMLVFLIKFNIKLNRKEKEVERLNREDWILHDLTACDED